MAKASDLQVRTVAPLTEDEVEQSPQMLYRPAQQLAGPPQFKVAYPVIEPDKMGQWLIRSKAEPDFANRTMRTVDVRRWKLLMETERFVWWLPDGPLLFDENDIMLNGWHRGSALIGYGKPIGMMTIRGVPRWMMKYFDTGRSRSLNDLFAIQRRMTKAQSGSTMRLALRYEEFLRAKRPGMGWRHWGSEKGDEHVDVDDFLARREELSDLYVAADKAAKKSRLIIASLMVWRFYQQLAWPDGDKAITEFWEGLVTGNQAPASPAITLRAWGRDEWEDKVYIQGKRELHLLLLNNAFRLAMQDDKWPTVKWAHGFVMTYPFHPDGAEIARKNIFAALDEMDKA